MWESKSAWEALDVSVGWTWSPLATFVSLPTEAVPSIFGDVVLHVTWVPWDEAAFPSNALCNPLTSEIAWEWVLSAFPEAIVSRASIASALSSIKSPSSFNVS